MSTITIPQSDRATALVGIATAKAAALRYAAAVSVLLIVALTSHGNALAFGSLTAAAFAWWLFWTALRQVAGWQMRAQIG